jgi:hypothetical protein
MKTESNQPLIKWFPRNAGTSGILSVALISLPILGCVGAGLLFSGEFREYASKSILQILLGGPFFTYGIASCLALLSDPEEFGSSPSIRFGVYCGLCASIYYATSFFPWDLLWPLDRGIIFGEGPSFAQLSLSAFLSPIAFVIAVDSIGASRLASVGFGTLSFVLIAYVMLISIGISGRWHSDPLGAIVVASIPLLNLSLFLIPEWFVFIFGYFLFHIWPATREDTLAFLTILSPIRVVRKRGSKTHR